MDLFLSENIRCPFGWGVEGGSTEFIKTVAGRQSASMRGNTGAGSKILLLRGLMNPRFMNILSFLYVCFRFFGFNDIF